MIFAKDEFLDGLSGLGWPGAIAFAVIIIALAWVAVTIIRKL